MARRKAPCSGSGEISRAHGLPLDLFWTFNSVFVGSQEGDQDGQTGRDLIGQCVVECLARPETANKVSVVSAPIVPLDYWPMVISFCFFGAFSSHFCSLDFFWGEGTIARARAVYYGGMTTLFLAGSEHHEPQDLQGGRRQVLSCQRPGRALGRESINGGQVQVESMQNYECDCGFALIPVDQMEVKVAVCLILKI